MQYQKEIAQTEEYDVVVCGAGVAGFAAAVQSARLGARTALLERYGMPGGVLTVGGNNEIGLFYRGSRQIISGIGWELVQRLKVKGWADIPEFDEKYDHSQQNVIVNGPMAAAEMDAMCMEAGVELLYHHTLCDAIADKGHICAVLAAAKPEMRMICGKYFIDATGDADLTAWSGGETQLGDGEPTQMQPGTLRFYWSGYVLSDVDKRQTEDSFRKGLETHELERSDYWSQEGSPYTVFAADGNNINHIPLNGADSLSRTRAEIEGRRSVARLAAWARHRVSGAEHIQPIACAPEVAARESRRVVGDHVITVEEYTQAVSYPDGVCYSYYPIDLHVHGEQTLYNISVREGAVPQLPYRALLVRGTDNLLAVGRCASGDRLAQSAFRVKASCMAMGQAAGCAAAMAADQGKTLRELSAEELCDMLKRQHAIVPEK